MRLLPTCACGLLVVACGASGPSAGDSTSDVPTAADAGADAAPGPDTASPPTDVVLSADADAADVPPGIAPAPAAWRAGGVLGTYVALGDDGAPLWEMTRLDDAIGAPWGSAALVDVAGGGPYEARWDGGLLVDEAGTWTLRATAGGGVVVTVDGAPLLDRRAPGAIVVEDASVDLAAGWHHLTVTWRHDPATPLLRLWWTPPGGAPQELAAGRLGWPDEPAGAPAILGVDVLDVGPFSARLAVRTSTPAQAAVQVAGPTGLVEAQSPPASWSSRTVLDVPLAKEAAWQVVATATDLWGRPAAPAHASLQTTGDGTWEPGALLGSYHQGMAFEELRLLRLDPGVRFPAQADDDPGGSFQAPMAPDQFSVRWEGALHVPEAGAWTLWYGTDDGQRLVLDGNLVAADWRDHGTSWVAAPLQLAEGWHPIALEMYENGGAAVAVLEWEGPSTPRAPVPPEALGTAPIPDDGAAPALTEVTAEPAGPGRARLVWRASELVHATLHAPGEEPAPLGPPATGGARVVDRLGEGPVTLTLTAEDLGGAPADPVSVTVDVEPLPPEEAAP